MRCVLLLILLLLCLLTIVHLGELRPDYGQGDAPDGSHGRGAAVLGRQTSQADTEVGLQGSRTGTVQYSTVQYRTVQYSTVQYSTVVTRCQLYDRFRAVFL